MCLVKAVPFSLNGKFQYFNSSVNFIINVFNLGISKWMILYFF